MALTFPRSQRLTHDLEFQAVYGGRVRRQAGPLIVFALPNGLGHPRLGLSVRRGRAGAVGRNRVKRLLREAFRQVQHDLPRAAGASMDFVVQARDHEPRPLADYQGQLLELAVQLAREWERRRRAGADEA